MSCVCCGYNCFPIVSKKTHDFGVSTYVKEPVPYSYKRLIRKRIPKNRVWVLCSIQQGPKFGTGKNLKSR